MSNITPGWHVIKVTNRTWGVAFFFSCGRCKDVQGISTSKKTGFDEAMTVAKRRNEESGFEPPKYVTFKTTSTIKLNEAVT